MTSSLLHVRNSGRGTWRRSAGNCEVFQRSVSYDYISEMSRSTPGKSRDTTRKSGTNETARERCLSGGNPVFRTGWYSDQINRLGERPHALAGTHERWSYAIACPHSACWIVL